MTLIVQKFGGTSVATPDHILNAARRVAYERKRGHQVIVVVSAMAGVTNQLVKDATKISTRVNPREYDAVVSSGEQVTAGLMALALQNHDLMARSFLAWQIPLKTTSHHGRATIEHLAPETLKACLAQGIVPVVAGFQGLTEDGSLTTLGRGGSDITAVALAVALGAERCDLYKDVSGIFTADPRIVPQARRLHKVAYEEMLELAGLGSKVLHSRAVELAMKHKLPLRIFSSFEESVGTHILDKEQIVEKSIVHGIAATPHETAFSVNADPSKLAALLRALSEAHIPPQLILQGGIGAYKEASFSFTVLQEDQQEVRKILDKELEKKTIEGFYIVPGLAKISVVGLGLKRHPEQTALILETLSAKNIEVMAVSTGEMTVSLLIPSDFTELAVRSIHNAFDLDHEKRQPGLYAIR